MQKYLPSFTFSCQFITKLEFKWIYIFYVVDLHKLAQVMK